ncbi:MAG: cytochrome c553 [Paracoccaceae bacterium]|jgi:cytochrome c553
MRNKLILSAATLVAALAFPAAAQDAAAGKKAADMRCAMCHGSDGLAMAPDAPNLAGADPDYILMQLGAFRSGARNHHQMSLIAAGLSEQEMEDIAAWFGRMQLTVTIPPLD